MAITRAIPPDKHHSQCTKCMQQLGNKSYSGLAPYTQGVSTKSMGEEESLEELKKKARFLEKEKRRILETQRKREEIDKLQREIHALNSEANEPTVNTSSPESSLHSAMRDGHWPDELDSQVAEAILEKKWEQEKDRQRKLAKETEINADKALWGCFGGLAVFFPIFWPIFLLQGFRAYPVTSFTILAIAVFLIIVISSIS